ncbi:hypothetical protein FXO37_11957 [Capsicum annuum]|nr:hypothetical protein FXO37_11957 [Capsicum annuum]
MGSQRRLKIYVGYESSSIIKYLEPITGDLFTARFADCHFDEIIYPTLGGKNKQLERKIDWNALSLSPLDFRTNKCELEVQRIIHLQNIANQLPDAFTDLSRITKSQIPAANAPIRVDVPIGQLSNANESKPHLKRGRPIGSKDKNPKKIRANDQNNHNMKEGTHEEQQHIIIDEISEKVQVDSTITERVGNVIPRIFNWKVVGIKVKYEKFMGDMFNKFVYTNLRSTHEEVQRLNLPTIDGVELNNDESALSHDTYPDHSGLNTRASASQPMKKRRTVRFDTTTVPMQDKRLDAPTLTPSSFSKSGHQDSSDQKWNELKFFLQSYQQDQQDQDVECLQKKDVPSKEQDFEGFSSDVGTSTLDAQVEEMVNQKLKDFGTATLNALVDAVVNQNPDYSKIQNPMTENIHEDHLDYAESVVVADNENAVNNIIKEFSIPAGLPWHLVDEVYVLMNCNQNFHWVLAIIDLKDRRICVYDSLSNLRNMDLFPEIQKLAVMLPTFSFDSGFFEKKFRTDWPNLDAYRDKLSDTTQLLNTNSFEVEYVQNIIQQDCDSLDCGIFVVGYAEYISEGMSVPSVDFKVAYHRMRYASLLRNYDLRKAKNDYVSENEDPSRPRPTKHSIPDEMIIVRIG